MPRDLQQSDRNKATFIDGVSGGEISFFFRTPTNAERIAYRTATVTRKGKQIIDQSAAVQLKYGARILTGIQDGDFVFGDKPVSSTPDSEHYNPDWKKLVVETAGDIVQSLALLAFAGVVLKYDGPEEEEEIEDALDMSEVPGLDEEPQDAGPEDKESPLD